MSARRQAFQAVSFGGEWPAELADPTATVWRSWPATRRWLEAQGVDSEDLPTLRTETPVQRRAAGITAWAVRHHPSEQWPNRADGHWMNESGLRAIDQAADRAAFEESITQDQYTP